MAEELSITLLEVSDSQLMDLQKISRETFYQTFSEYNKEEDMILYLEHSLSAEKLSEELANPNSRFYFAVLGGENVGYIKLNLEPDAVEIERIYIRNPYQGKRIGQQVLDKALEIAQNRKVAAVWLGVWEHNARAIAFYKKNGFESFDQHVFMLGSDKQTDILMRRYLTHSE